MKNNKIEVGDTVRVVFRDGGYIVGEILYTPCATGDSWHVKELLSNDIVYLQNFDLMRLQRKGEIR